MPVTFFTLPFPILEKFSTLLAETRVSQPTDDAASSRSRYLQASYYYSGVDDGAPTLAPTVTSAPTMTPAPTIAPFGNVSTFSALSAYCQIDNADITVTGDITFTDQIIITGRTVSITSTTDVVLTSDRSFSTNTGGMLLIEDGSEVALTGLHFVSGSAITYGGCLYVENSDLAIFNSSFTSCFSSVGGAYIGRVKPAYLMTKVSGHYVEAGRNVRPAGCSRAQPLVYPSASRALSVLP